MIKGPALFHRAFKQFLVHQSCKMATRSYIAPTSLRIAIGTEDAVCIDHADLRRLASYNLPPKLKALADLAAGKIHDWSELDVDSSDDTPNGSSHDGLHVRTTYRRGYYEMREMREWQEAAEEEDRQRQKDEENEKDRLEREAGEASKGDRERQTSAGGRIRANEARGGETED